MDPVILAGRHLHLVVCYACPKNFIMRSRLPTYCMISFYSLLYNSCFVTILFHSFQASPVGNPRPSSINTSDGDPRLRKEYFFYGGCGDSDRCSDGQVWWIW